MGNQNLRYIYYTEKKVAISKTKCQEALRIENRDM